MLGVFGGLWPQTPGINRILDLAVVWAVVWASGPVLRRGSDCFAIVIDDW